MAARHWTGFFLGIDRDRPLMAVLGLLLLLVPVFHPLAEAFAAGKPYASVICTTFGARRSLDQSGNSQPGAADDCPCCIACSTHCGAAVPLPAAAVLPSPSGKPLHVVPPRFQAPLRPFEPNRPPGRAPPLHRGSRTRAAQARRMLSSDA